MFGGKKRDVGLSGVRKGYLDFFHFHRSGQKRSINLNAMTDETYMPLQMNRTKIEISLSIFFKL